MRLASTFVCGCLLVLGLLWMAGKQSQRVFAGGPVEHTPVILYVSTRGDDIGNDCQTRLTPCQTVQHALQESQTGDYIHVASGLYSGSMFDPEIALGVTATVIITKDIGSLLGGYSQDFTTRDIETNLTILSAQGVPGAYVAVLADTDVRFGGFTLTGASGAYAPGGFKYPGGAVRIFGGSPTIQDNRIAHNQAFRRGGGIYIGRSASPSIVNNRIVSNRVIPAEGDNTSAGGGIYLASGPTLVSGNQIMSNTAQLEGGGIYVGWNVPATIISNTISFNKLSDATFSEGAGIHTSGNKTQVVIHGNHITGNRLVGGFEGSALFVASPALIDANLIENNFAPGVHAALCIVNVAEPVTVTNNLIVENSSLGVRLISSGDVNLINNTISGNTFRGLQVYFPESGQGSEPALTLHNNIITNNGECGVFVENDGLQDMGYNDVFGQRYQYCGFPDISEHNLSTNPFFVERNGVHYHLSAGSPVINQGNPSTAPVLDFDGNKRSTYYNVDLGALEFVYPRVYLPIVSK